MAAVKPWNDRRVAKADTAVRPYHFGVEHDTAASDLLADLMHWCDAHDVAFDAIVDSATRHYSYERDNED